MTPRAILTAATLLVGASAILASSAARADFVLTDQLQTSEFESSNHFGMALDGDTCHIAVPFAGHFNTFDSDFQLITTTPVAGVGDLRGLDRDPITGHLFVSDQDTSIVREILVDGTELHQFPAFNGPAMEGLCFDPETESLWLVHIDGRVENRSRTGTLLSSFAITEELAGVSYDTRSETLLFLTNHDKLLEYTTSGSFIEQHTSDIYEGNGLGLCYVSSTGRLYVTSQMGWVTILDDPPRTNTCRVDVDRSGAVDFGDILAILSAWGSVGGLEDLDGSGFVDFGDLVLVLAEWGGCV